MDKMEVMLTTFVLGVMKFSDGKLPFACCADCNVMTIEKALEVARPEFAQLPIPDAAIMEDMLYRIVAKMRQAENAPLN